MAAFIRPLRKGESMTYQERLDNRINPCLKCKLCDFKVKKWYSKNGKLFTPDNAFKHLARHFEYAHPVEAAALDEKMIAAI
jgi:hypothetical protein